MPTARAVLLLLAISASGCATALDRGADDPREADPQLAELAAWLTGRFSSAAQAEAAPEDFFDIRLATAPIWTERDDGPWLYVEQAAATALDSPYRQRVYHLVRDDAGLRSDVYTLPGDPLAYAGAADEPARLDVLAPDDLELRVGCSIHLVRIGDAFVGATRGTGCASNLGEAVYATSEVTITADALESWDRGFDAEGRQAWGATQGPYEFLRLDG